MITFSYINNSAIAKAETERSAAEKASPWVVAYWSICSSTAEQQGVTEFAPTGGVMTGARARGMNSGAMGCGVASGISGGEAQLLAGDCLVKRARRPLSILPLNTLPLNILPVFTSWKATNSSEPVMSEIADMMAIFLNRAFFGSRPTSFFSCTPSFFTCDMNMAHLLGDGATVLGLCIFLQKGWDGLG